ncbi:hypothetical protein [Nonomuraea wenchangensis]|uniref:Uncharacterized protein n=1 Tax=Nonomuraea wenchangensis TaxID=568860 RepID=A0A1I0LFU6_9ACTN|nr:hypothetical protein [Nonomuraea wenchangensis]SEU38691.1 hypothetical protein SAMN05421811_1165 [Nonomuraea wenchangensis]
MNPNEQPEPIRPKCALSNGTWDQVFDEEKGEWVCPPDPFKTAEEESA